LRNGATDGDIRDMLFDAEGNLYVVGAFSSMDNGGGAVANTAYVAMWDGTDWIAVGTGGAGANKTAYAIAIDKDGNIYVGGDDFTMGGVADTERIAMWNGATWAKVSTGAYSGIDDGQIHDIAINVNNMVYCAGTFTAVDNGTTANRIAAWDGAAWAALGSGFNGVCYCLAIDNAGLVYAGGDYTTADGNLVSKISKWDGVVLSPLTDETINGAIWDALIGPDGILYIGGAFSSIGDLDVATSVAKWTGASWAHTDIAFPGGVNRMVIGAKDPVVPNNYDLYAAYGASGVTLTVAGDTTITNDGTASAYPKLIIKRDGGTSATLVHLRNETSGKILYLNYPLNDGEQLTIDLTPTEKTIISSLYGPRMDAILPNSDFGSFKLLPGDNNITCLVNVAGDPTIICYLLWKDTYKSYD